ncbi:hypothetical protein [Aromatoleum anaerobium]|uniref:DUF3618 domain-containing protein n=1 Tax=Aromatoleum anaerobium TaxID=182180 RepID=A0ABX1PPR7_9RHOO|nr:hypothetical protein [Aromatoleum anaerobium]MCK0508338.1 hypothetical protein [Aromatoleum anaerobium]
MNTRGGSLAEAEARVARERALLDAQFDAWRAHVRSELASPRGLGTALMMGFVVGNVMRRRPPRHEAAAPVRKGFLAVATGLALSALRWRYGNPWAAVPQLVGWLQQQGAGRAAPSGAAATPSPPWQGPRAIAKR